MIRFLLLFPFLSNVLYCDLEDHFKPITDKSNFHQMRNIDFIYMINLDQRPEKFEICLAQLMPYRIAPYRFSAVNGWELSLETINDVGVQYEPWMVYGRLGTYFPTYGDKTPQVEPIAIPGRTYFCDHMPLGSIGIVLSHLSILQDALKSGYETIWVMEDDIEVIQNPHLISEMIDKLDDLVGKDGWDILFTDKDTKSQEGEYVPCVDFAWRPNFVPANSQLSAEKNEISEDLRQVGARFGAYSMIVRKSGMRKILNFFKHYHIFLPFDIEYTLPQGIRFFTVINDIVSTQPNAISDNAIPNYKKAGHEISATE